MFTTKQIDALRCYFAGGYMTPHQDRIIAGLVRLLGQDRVWAAAERCSRPRAATLDDVWGPASRWGGRDAPVR